MTTVGNYYCDSNSDAVTLKNTPFTHAFTLKIGLATGKSYQYQEATEYDTGRKARRVYNWSISTWSDWLYFSDDATILSNLTPIFGDLSTIYIGSANLTLTNGASYITDPRIHVGSIILAQADFAPALSGALLTCSVQPMSGRANFYIRNMVDGSIPEDDSVIKINFMVFNK